MEDKASLFSDFSTYSKKEWLQKVEKDLKGKPLEILNWELEEGISLSPFFHSDDLEALRPPLDRPGAINDWEVGESIHVEDVLEANRTAIEALKGGANALGFELYHPLNANDLTALLQGIDMELISTNFGEMYIEKHPDRLLQLLVDYINEKGYDSTKMEGSIDFDPYLDWSEPPLFQAGKSIQKGAADLPRFKVLQINGTYYHAGEEESSRELALITGKFSAYLEQMMQQGLAPDIIVKAMQVSVSLSKNYFVEIGKLRALKIVLANVARHYGCQQHFVPQVVAHFAKESQVDNPNTNLIQATTQAMSAVLGGVDRLYVLPANAYSGDPASPFTRRMARNIQHILKMESFLHQVIDPAAGSYYIEQITQILAEKAWTQFQLFEKEGAFNLT